MPRTDCVTVWCATTLRRVGKQTLACSTSRQNCRTPSSRNPAAQSSGHTVTCTHRHRHRVTGSHRHIHTHRETHRHTTHKERHTDKDRDRQTDTDIQVMAETQFSSRQGRRTTTATRKGFLEKENKNRKAADKKAHQGPGHCAQRTRPCAGECVSLGGKRVVVPCFSARRTPTSVQFLPKRK